MLRRPSRSSLFPYTTLFRSVREQLLSIGASRVVAAAAEENVSPGCKGFGAYSAVEVIGLAVRVDANIGEVVAEGWLEVAPRDRKSTRLNSSHLGISYAVFCL